jgi:hypothetical protein
VQRLQAARHAGCRIAGDVDAVVGGDAQFIRFRRRLAIHCADAQAQRHRRATGIALRQVAREQ